MIDLYTADTPNGARVELMLEELELPYHRHQMTLSNGDTHSAEFISINPTGRIPVIIDHAPTGNDAAISLNQSAAILIYLAEKTGRFLPLDHDSRAKTFEWLFFDATDIATTRFNAFYLFRNKLPRATPILTKRIMEYYSVYDQRLGESRFLAGDEYTIADIAAYPWAKTMKHSKIKEMKNIQRWITEIELRDSVKKLNSNDQNMNG